MLSVPVIGLERLLRGDFGVLQSCHNIVLLGVLGGLVLCCRAQGESKQLLHNPRLFGA